MHSIIFATWALLMGATAATDFVCEKDTQENCNVLSCRTSVNAQCVKNGARNECYCGEGDCAVPKGDSTNDLHCVATPKCAAYSACAALGLTGDCCPPVNGTDLDCCNSVEDTSGARTSAGMSTSLMLLAGASFAL